MKTLEGIFKIMYSAVMAAMDAGTIRAWAAQAETDLAELIAEAERLQRRVAQARMQLELMYELLATVSNEPVQRSSEFAFAERSVRDRVVESVIQILQERGDPMRIQDIHAEFLRRELPLPGSGTPTNIAAHLVNRDLFSRPRRGVFGLTEWDGLPRLVEPEVDPRRGKRKKS